MKKNKQEKIITIATKFKKLEKEEEKDIAALCLNALIVGKKIGKEEALKELTKYEI